MSQTEPIARKPALPTRLYRALWTANPLYVMLFGLVVGLVLVLASAVTGVAFVSYQTPDGLIKQVGFVPSLSWSMTLVVFFPGALFCAFRACRVLTRTILRMPDRHMLAHRDWTPATTEDAQGLLDEIWGATLPFGLFFLVIGLSFGTWDFIEVVARPLLSGELGVGVGEEDFVHEIDWSVAAILGDSATRPGPGVMPNLVFSGLAYLAVTIETSLLMAFFGLLIGLAIVLYRLSDEDHRLRLTPNVYSDDPRRGFEVFAPFFLVMLGAALQAYIACYLMRIQNLFLRDAGFARLDQMLFQDLSDALSGAIVVPHDVDSFIYRLVEGFLEVLDAMFAAGDLSDIQAYTGAATILVGVLIAVFAMTAVLRNAASEAREETEEDLAKPDQREAVEAYYSMSAEEIRLRIGKADMEVWPLEWPKLNAFLTFIALGIVCFIFYRLAILWLAAQVMRLFKKTDA
ncbi:hypothetical protein [Parvularcula sp. LCG005]|uniref:hypothetical protein n=1 Tax=Parvularcula sp. LCG005 TaxID=3078805 RepID=UPI002942C066|nr:hypothetical protein [Parvularcula sp. LCG005]WOI53232.1 hypothetical protein RUI03_13880 [Parvularcula sp. LCG005]